jgi:hypothetical protein
LHPDAAPLARIAAVAAAFAVIAMIGGVAGAPGAAPSYRETVVADNPAGYWRLGEAGGSVAVDETGRSPGTYRGGVALGVAGAIAGDADTAAGLDGANDLVDMGNPTAGTLEVGTGDFSAEAWINTVANGEQAVIGKRASGRYWQVTVTDDAGNAGRLRASVADGTATRQAYSTRRVDDGAWHHIVVRFDRDVGIAFFVDGVPAGSGAGPMPGNLANTANLQVGKLPSYPYFRGQIDEVALFRSLLPTDRVQQHYLAGTSDTTPPVVVLSSPAHGSSTTDTTPGFSGTAGTALGDSATVTIRVHSGTDTSGTAVETLEATRGAGGAYSVEPAALALGTYTAHAEQVDAAGNVGRSAPSTFEIVDGPPPPPPPAADPVFVGAGDIADCGMTARDEETAQLLDALPQATVFTTGDNAYPAGRPEEYANCYDPTWGRAKARTYPSPGNHDYVTDGAPGYFGYFGAVAGDPAQGWYSFDLGAWHIVSLNGNCFEVGGCDPGSPQEQWLRADLAAHPVACTLAYWHQPRFSSGSNHGSDTTFAPLWDALYEYGAELILNGHEHFYERFLPQTPSGTLDPDHGITQITVGTGGFALYPFGTILPNSAARINDTHGVLKLVLHPSSYDWEFLPIAGQSATDSGARDCHDASSAPPPPPPPPPPDTTAPSPTLTAPAGGSSTSDATPEFSGTAGTEVGDSSTVAVRVFEGSGTGGALVQTLSATRGAGGAYAVVASPPLAPGTYTAQAEQSDSAGNTGLSAPATFTVVEPPPAAPYPSEVLAEGPRAYWRLGETSGTTAVDELGGAPGSYLGGVTLGVPGAIAGDANTAVRLDGGDDRASVADRAALDFGSGDFSAELWLSTSVNGERAAISKLASGPYWLVTVTDDSGHAGEIRAKLFDGVVTRQVYGPPLRVDDGAWHHIVVVYDRDNGITVYVDGVARTTPGPMAGDVSNSAALLVGKASGYGYFNGVLDEVALYPAALTAERVGRHYEAGRGGVVAPLGAFAG